MITIKLNGKSIEAKEGATILDVALEQGIYIPTLCHHPALKPTGACRMCLVEAGPAGRRKKVVTSCTFPVKEGLEIETDTPRVQTNRKVLMELLQARAPESKELKDMAVRIGLKSGSSFEPVEGSDCILCGLCVRVCDEVVGVNAINFNGRGGEMHVGGPLMTTPEACIGCGACVYVCPVDCIKMVDTAEERVIVKWDRHLPLKKCESCGWPFMPNFQALQFKKMADIPREFFTKCQDCRR